MCSFTLPNIFHCPYNCSHCCCRHEWVLNPLLAFIALSAAQSSAQKHIHNAILVIDTSNNASYNQVHWIVGMPYLSIEASNEFNEKTQ